MIANAMLEVIAVWFAPVLVSAYVLDRLIRRLERRRP